MAKVLSLINGVPRTIDTTAVNVFQETETVPAGGYPQGTTVTIPSSGNYNSTDLKVFYNGLLLEPGVDYIYVGSAPRTQIEILRTDVSEGDKLIFVIEGEFAIIYDQTAPTTGYAAGSNVTLPNGETYNDVDLKVFLDGTFLEPGQDYNYVGIIPRTEIQLVIEVFAGERLRFRKEG